MALLSRTVLALARTTYVFHAGNLKQRLPFSFASFSGVEPVAALPISTTLVANTPATVTWDTNGPAKARVINTTASTVAWVRANGTAAVAGTECWPVVGGDMQGIVVPVLMNAAANSASVSVISAGTPVVTIVPVCGDD